MLSSNTELRGGILDLFLKIMVFIYKNHLAHVTNLIILAIYFTGSLSAQTLATLGDDGGSGNVYMCDFEMSEVNLDTSCPLFGADSDWRMRVSPNLPNVTAFSGERFLLATIPLDVDDTGSSQAFTSEYIPDVMCLQFWFRVSQDQDSDFLLVIQSANLTLVKHHLKNMLPGGAVHGWYPVQVRFEEPQIAFQFSMILERSPTTSNNGSREAWAAIDSISIADSSSECLHELGTSAAIVIRPDVDIDSLDRCPECSEHFQQCIDEGDGYVCLEQPELEGCGEATYCVRYPRDCDSSVTADTCHLLIQVEGGLGNVLGISMHHKLKELQPDAYISLGFSRDRTMGDEMVASCLVKEGGAYIENSYNPGHWNSVVHPDVAGILESTASYEDRYLTCNMTKLVSPNAQDFQLNGEYHLLIAIGRLGENGQKLRHESTFSTSTTINIEEETEIPDGCQLLNEECQTCYYGNVMVDGCPVCECEEPCRDYECGEDEGCIVSPSCLDPSTPCLYLPSCVFTCPSPCLYNVSLPTNDESVSLHSPGWPTDYPKDCLCTWYLNVPTGYTMSLAFTDLDMEGPVHACPYDKIIVSSSSRFASNDQHNHGVFCGSPEVPPLVQSSPDNNLNIFFKSDRDTTGRGFQVEVSAQPLITNTNLLLLPYLDQDAVSFPILTGRNMELKKVLSLINVAPDILQVLLQTLTTRDRRSTPFWRALSTSPSMALPWFCQTTDLSPYFLISEGINLDLSKIQTIFCSIDPVEMMMELEEVKISDIFEEYLLVDPTRTTLTDLLSAILNEAQYRDEETVINDIDFSVIYPRRWQTLVYGISAAITNMQNGEDILNIFFSLQPLFEIQKDSKEFVYILNNVLSTVSSRIKYITEQGTFKLVDLIPDTMLTWRSLVIDLLPALPDIFDIIINVLPQPEFHKMLELDKESAWNLICTGSNDELLTYFPLRPHEEDMPVWFHLPIRAKVCGIELSKMKTEVGDTLKINELSNLHMIGISELLSDLADTLFNLISLYKTEFAPTFSEETWMQPAPWDQVIKMWQAKYPTSEDIFYYLSDSLPVLYHIYSTSFGDLAPSLVGHSTIYLIQSSLDVATEQMRQFTGRTMSIAETLPEEFTYLNLKISEAADLFASFLENCLYAMLGRPLQFLDQFSLDSMRDFCNANTNNVFNIFNFYDTTNTRWLLHYLCTFDPILAGNELQRLFSQLQYEIYEGMMAKFTSSRPNPSSYKEDESDELEVDLDEEIRFKSIHWRYFASSCTRALDSYYNVLDNPPTFSDIHHVPSLVYEGLNRVYGYVGMDEIVELIIELHNTIVPMPEAVTQNYTQHFMSMEEFVKMNSSMMYHNSGAESMVGNIRIYLSDVRELAEGIWNTFTAATMKHEELDYVSVDPNVPTSTEGEREGEEDEEAENEDEEANEDEEVKEDEKEDDDGKEDEEDLQKEEERTNAIQGELSGEEQVKGKAEHGMVSWYILIPSLLISHTFLLVC